MVASVMVVPAAHLSIVYIVTKHHSHEFVCDLLQEALRLQYSLALTIIPRSVFKNLHATCEFLRDFLNLVLESTS